MKKLMPPSVTLLLMLSSSLMVGCATTDESPSSVSLGVNSQSDKPCEVDEKSKSPAWMSYDKTIEKSELYSFLDSPTSPPKWLGGCSAAGMADGWGTLEIFTKPSSFSLNTSIIKNELTGQMVNGKFNGAVQLKRNDTLFDDNLFVDGSNWRNGEFIGFADPNLTQRSHKADIKRRQDNKKTYGTETPSLEQKLIRGGTVMRKVLGTDKVSNAQYKCAAPCYAQHEMAMASCVGLDKTESFGSTSDYNKCTFAADRTKNICINACP
ncbi:hypothetical protein [Thiothrix subterranea]|uniref:Uncharacterized protein n=1 Tax=Thiothrix subterranea TaxID=2735563 RepID=A0AA51MPE7_9GAMM|nr:hypothetical protein [Thiothrix subterranea]MDQ5767182.1 hypothetical protein [Thiothrix subterranea]WML87955.1 hypothetical protein RCG00_06190 [Thiothrix subterranea]